MVLVGLILSLSHKSYEMIFETADNVMRWVGFGSRPLGEAQGEQSTNRVYGGAAIYSRGAAGAAVAKGNGRPGGGGNYAPIGQHEQHNRTNSDTDYNGGGTSNSGNTPPSGGGGGGNNGGSPGNGGGGGQGRGSGGGQDAGTGAPSATPQGGDRAGDGGQGGEAQKY